MQGILFQLSLSGCFGQIITCGIHLREAGFEEELSFLGE